MFPLIKPNHAPHIFHPPNRHGLQERNQPDQLLGRFGPGSRTKPGREEDSVGRLELDVRRVGVEDDGPLEGSTEVGEIFDYRVVFVAGGFTEELPGNVGAVRVDFLDYGKSGLREGKKEGREGGVRWKEEGGGRGGGGDGRRKVGL